MSYSVKQLESIAENEPEELAKIINNNIADIYTLSRAVEILGESCICEKDILPILKRLLMHIHVSIRESTLSSISSYYKGRKLPKDLLDRIKIILKSDPSVDVRDCAKDVLQEFER